MGSNQAFNFSFSKMGEVVFLMEMMRVGRENALILERARVVEVMCSGR